MKKEELSRRDVLIICQFAVVAGYRSFFEHLAEHDPSRRVELIVPDRFRELGAQLVECAPLRPEAPKNLTLRKIKVFAPHVQVMVLWYLWRYLRDDGNRMRTEPPLLIALVEPYSVSFLWVWICTKLSRFKGEIWAYTLQNIYKVFRWPLSAIQRLGFRSVSLILASGEEQTQVLRRQGYTGPVLYFPLWYDESRFYLSDKPRRDGERIRVAFIGKVASEKGVFDFLDALQHSEALLREKIEVHLAGGGPERPRLEERIDELRRNSWAVVDKGPLPFDEIPSCFHDIDILLVPSRTMSNWKEQFGRVIVEALACGVTVLGSDSGEIPHVIGDPNRVFKEANPPSLADCLLKNLKTTSEIRQANHLSALTRFSSRARAVALSEAIAASEGVSS